MLCYIPFLRELELAQTTQVCVKAYDPFYIKLIRVSPEHMLHKRD